MCQNENVNLRKIKDYKMQVQTNTDHNVEHTNALTTHVETVVTEMLSRFSDQTTRVIVHLSEGKDSKNPHGDHRCMMEAHIKNHAPVVANDHAESMHQAIHHTAEKLKRALDTTLGKLNTKTKGGHRISENLLSEMTPDTEI
jgi:ribosomal subunit interface protein